MPRSGSGETSNEERYNYLYAAAELEPWVERIRDGAARVLPGGGVYAILNNHFRGQAVANALMLQKELTGETRPLPETLLAAYPQLAPITAPPSSGLGQRRLF